jgi:hypothetical protein
VTTTVDGGSDFITHVQVNDGDSDSAALLGALSGSEEKTGQRHRTVVADSGSLLLIITRSWRERGKML